MTVDTKCPACGGADTGPIEDLRCLRAEIYEAEYAWQRVLRALRLHVHVDSERVGTMAATRDSQAGANESRQMFDRLLDSFERLVSLAETVDGEEHRVDYEAFDYIRKHRAEIQAARDMLNALWACRDALDAMAEGTDFNTAIENSGATAKAIDAIAKAEGRA